MFAAEPGDFFAGRMRFSECFRHVYFHLHGHRTVRWNSRRDARDLCLVFASGKRDCECPAELHRHSRRDVERRLALLVAVLRAAPLSHPGIVGQRCAKKHASEKQANVGRLLIGEIAML